MLPSVSMTGKMLTGIKKNLFMQRIELYTFLQSIPKGKVTTYGAIAKRFGTSPRAIASMLHANIELDIYPCYKVIHTNGRVGGYRG